MKTNSLLFWLFSYEFIGLALKTLNSKMNQVHFMMFLAPQMELPVASTMAL